MLCTAGGLQAGQGARLGCATFKTIDHWTATATESPALRIGLPLHSAMRKRHQSTPARASGGQCRRGGQACALAYLLTCAGRAIALKWSVVMSITLGVSACADTHDTEGSSAGQTGTRGAIARPDSWSSWAGAGRACDAGKHPPGQRSGTCAHRGHRPGRSFELRRVPYSADTDYKIRRVRADKQSGNRARRRRTVEWVGGFIMKRHNGRTLN